MKSKLDIRTVLDAQKLVKGYYQSIKSYDTEINQIKNNFKGDMLKEKLTSHEILKPNEDRAIAELDMFKNDMLADLEAIGKCKSYDPKNITPDYAFLTLPVTLTADELTMLRDRNIENPLFCRALQQYTKIHKIDDFIDLSDNISSRKRIIESFFKDMTDSIRRPDEFTLGFMESGDYFENVMSMLEDTYIPESNSISMQVDITGDSTEKPQDDNIANSDTERTEQNNDSN